MLFIKFSSIFGGLGLFFLLGGVAWSQGGFVDPSFSAGIVPNGYVYALVQQSDQKIIVAGSFTSLGAASGSHLARLNADGTVDSSFGPEGLPNQAVNRVVVQENGKIVIAGSFTSIGPHSRRGLARLNSDGSVDTSFDAGTGTSSSGIDAIAVQTDGKLLVGGYFHAFNGDSTKGNLVRLNANGTIDPTFNGYTGMNGQVFSVVLQGDGKILLAGRFTTVNGIARKYVVRLNVDGSLDTGFDAGTGPAVEGSEVMLQSNGKVIVQGDFTGTTAADSRRNLYRLNEDGSLDPTYDLGTGLGFVLPKVALGPDDRAVLAGAFTMVDGLTRLRIARLETDGTVDPLFDAGNLFPTTTHPGINAVLVQSDGRVVLAPYGRPMVRLNSAGEVPPPGAAPVLSSLSDGNGVRLMWTDVTHEEGYKIERSPDGTADWTAVATLTDARTRRIYDAGLISGATYRYRVRAFNRFGDGTFSDAFAAQVLNGVWPGQVDLSLDPSTVGIVSGTAASVTQPDGKLIVAANYKANESSTARTVIARLNADGSLERFFDAVTDHSEPFSLLLQPDGKLVVGGRFKVANGTVERSIARFNTDGTEDPGFSAVVLSYYGFGIIRTMALQADGKLLIGGYFTQTNQTPSGHFTRLNPDGSVDPSFSPGTGANAEVTALAIDSIGRIVIGGHFSEINGTSCGRAARLLANGGFDPSFSAIPGADGAVKCLAVQPDDRVILAGDFTTYNGTACNRVVRLEGDGSLDTGFNVPAGPNQITALFLQPDGKSIIAGTFELIGDTARRSIARLTTTGSLDAEFNAGGGVSFNSISASTNGEVVAAGDVTFANGMVQPGLSRLSIVGGPPPPPKPLGLTAVGINASQLRLTWTDVPGETGYLIERSLNGTNGWTEAGMAAADTPTFTDSGLAQSTHYYYRVRSSNLQGASAPSANGDAYTMTLPIAPTQFVVRSYGATEAILTWKSSGYTDRFVIERSTSSSGNWTTVATISLYSDIYRDTGLDAQTQYVYRIRVLNNGGDSDVTGAASTTTASPGWVPAGSQDPTLTRGEGFARTPGDYNGSGIGEILLQSDGKMIVCGRFGSYGGVARKNIARLHPDGSLDLTFDPGAWNSSSVGVAALQPDGKIVVGGSFMDPDGFTRPNIVRLNSDGSTDPTFNASAAITPVHYTSFYYGFHSLALQADGKVIAGGNSLIRLNSDGTKDTGFTAAVTGSGFTPYIYSLIITPEGKILLSGNFSAINGTIRREFARLHDNGSVDTGFDAGIQYSNTNGFVSGYAIVLQPDGKILRAKPRYAAGGMERFHSNGTLDASFTPPVLSYEGVLDFLALQSDGRIVVMGAFTTIAGFRRQGIARLNADGTFDTTFDSGLGNRGSALVIQPDGKIVLSSGFTAPDGQSRSSVVRLFGAPVTWDSLQQWKLSFGISPIASDSADLDLDGMPGLVEYALGGNPLVADRQILPVAGVTSDSLTLSFNKPRPDVSYVVETSENLVSWTTETVHQGGVHISAVASVPRAGSTQRFLRLSLSRQISP